MSYNVVNFQKKVQNSNDIGFFLETSLGDSKKQGMANMMVAINNSEKLATCDPMSVAAAIIQPTMLGLSLSTGEAYIIPYGNKATMQLGYKALISLALRTKEFKILNADDVKEGEFAGKDRLSGEYKFNWIEDEADRSTKKTIGYFGHFELTNGFRKTIFMTQEELHTHFVKFSKFNYDATKREWKGGLLTIHEKSKITLLKKLILKWAPKSSEIVQAVKSDGATFNEKGQMEINPNGEEIQSSRIPANKEDIKSVLTQVGNGIKEKELAKTQKEAQAITMQYARDPEVNIDFGVSGGWYGVTRDELKLFAGKAEKELEIEIMVNGSRLSQETTEAEKEKEITI